MPILIHLKVSGNGKMLDHDDDSLENINILVDMLINLYLQNVKKYLRIFWTMQVACWWHHIPAQYNVNTYFVLFLPYTLYLTLPPPLPCIRFFFNKKEVAVSPTLLNMTRIYLGNVIFGLWVEESQYLITLEYFSWYFCKDVNILKNCYIFFVGLC